MFGPLSLNLAAGDGGDDLVPDRDPAVVRKPEFRHVVESDLRDTYFLSLLPFDGYFSGVDGLGKNTGMDRAGASASGHARGAAWTVLETAFRVPLVGLVEKIAAACGPRRGSPPFLRSFRRDSAPGRFALTTAVVYYLGLPESSVCRLPPHRQFQFRGTTGEVAQRLKSDAWKPCVG